jgi:glutathione S-transferase
MQYPVLYSFRRCPYAMRARMALLASGTTCELREIVLRNKPQEMLQASPKATVPVLVLPDGRVIDESLDIMLWALDNNDPQRWLAPETESLEAMLQLIARNDGNFKHHLDRYKYPDRYDHVDPLQHRTQGSQFLASMEDRLARHSFLFGPRPVLADMAIFPFIRQFAETDRTWFDAQPWPNLHRWLGGLLSAELFEKTMQKFEPWRFDSTPMLLRAESR